MPAGFLSLKQVLMHKLPFFFVILVSFPSQGLSPQTAHISSCPLIKGLLIYTTCLLGGV